MENAEMLLGATNYFTGTCLECATKTVFVMSSAPVVGTVDEEQ